MIDVTVYDCKYEYIRQNSELFYLFKDANTLDQIITQLLWFVVRLGNADVTIKNMEKLYYFSSSLDWIELNGPPIERIFESFNPHPALRENSVRPEVLLNAYKFDFYTSGVSGSYGSPELQEVCSKKVGKNTSFGEGRFLIVKKPDISNL